LPTKIDYLNHNVTDLGFIKMLRFLPVKLKTRWKSSDELDS